jgi:uncharacterized protein YidB (DUF937 family)
MGLLDILNGMQNGPRGQQQPKNIGSSGGMSPIMKALLGVLAYKALKGGSGQAAAPEGMGHPVPLPPRGNINAGTAGGGLGDILGGLLGGKPGPAAAGAKPNGGLGDLLGGLLGGAAAGSVLSGGLGNLIKELQESGQGRVALSWVGTGDNEEIAPNELARALGDDTLATLSQQIGIGHQDLLAGLSQHLPDLINQLTPNGRLPSEEEASRML